MCFPVIARKTVFLSLLLFLSCSTPNSGDDINIELTSFAKEFVNAFDEFQTTHTTKDSTSTYIIRCSKNSIVLFEYDGFSHKDLVGKTKYNDNLVKIYGEACPAIYTELHRTKDTENYNTDDNYIEDLWEWGLSFYADTIFIDVDGSRNVLNVRDICKKHFPENIVIWPGWAYFKLDEIQL